MAKPGLDVRQRSTAGDQPRDMGVPQIMEPERRYVFRRLSRQHIHESINASLTRLQTDYVDVYQAHRYDFSTPLEETMEAFADVVRAGKALYIGVSEWTPQQLRAGHRLARELKISFVSNQSKHNALYRVIEPEVVPTCQELGIGQISSPIEQGVLTGKYQPGQPVPQDSRATDAHGAEFIKGLLTDEMLTRVQRLAPLAEAEGLTMAQMAVAWVLQNDNVASAITGGSWPEQVKANAAAAGKSLSTETLAGIDEALGAAVERDGSLVGSMSPKTRPT